MSKKNQAVSTPVIPVTREAKVKDCCSRQALGKKYKSLSEKQKGYRALA
jgi:hypothetical protein